MWGFTRCLSILWSFRWRTGLEFSTWIIMRWPRQLQMVWIRKLQPCLLLNRSTLCSPWLGKCNYGFLRRTFDWKHKEMSQLLWLCKIWNWQSRRVWVGESFEYSSSITNSVLRWTEAKGTRIYLPRCSSTAKQPLFKIEDQETNQAPVTVREPMITWVT